MNALHKRRLYIISLFVIVTGIATALILYALKQNINVFLTPKQITTSTIKSGYPFRLGGVVKAASLQRDSHSLKVQFVVTDFKRDITVQYDGVLPDLFREGKGVIAEGHLDHSGVFMATQVLAKHDENYMPKNVYKALRDQT